MFSLIDSVRRSNRQTELPAASFGDQVAQQLARTAGHGPAKRAAGRVDPQILYGVRPQSACRPGSLGAGPVQNVACSMKPPRGEIAHDHLQRFTTRFEQLGIGSPRFPPCPRRRDPVIEAE